MSRDFEIGNLIQISGYSFHWLNIPKTICMHMHTRVYTSRFSINNLIGNMSYVISVSGHFNEVQHYMLG